MIPPQDRDEADKRITDEEQREAEALRVALETGNTAQRDANVARAIAAAMLPSELTEAQHQVAFARAEWLTAQRVRDARKNWVRGFVAATVTFSTAAAIVLLVWGARTSKSVPSNGFGTSTQSLFTEPFAQDTSASTERLDRIVEARSHAFRYQRYEQWGVR